VEQLGSPTIKIDTCNRSLEMKLCYPQGKLNRMVAGCTEVADWKDIFVAALDLNRPTPLPVRLVQMLQSPDELHVAIKIGNEKSV